MTKRRPRARAKRRGKSAKKKRQAKKRTTKPVRKIFAKTVFVFDLDDTVMYNRHLYILPLIDAMRYIVQVLGPKTPDITDIFNLERKIGRERIHMVDPNTGERIGYSVERSIGGLVETYRQICSMPDVNVRPLKRIEWKLREIGMGAFKKDLYRKNIHPCARSLFRFLLQRGAKIVICTKGQESTQFDKITALKRAGIFKNGDVGVEIVPNKSVKVFRDIAAKYAGYRFYAIGNNYFADIDPALKADPAGPQNQPEAAHLYYGVYIPAPTFETAGRMHEILGRVDKKRCAVLNNLEDVKEWLLKRSRQSI